MSARHRRSTAHSQTPDEQAFARMFNERGAARREGRRAYQMAAAFDALPLVPLTDAVLDRLHEAEGWTADVLRVLRDHLRSDEWPEAGYSPTTESVFTPDLTATEFEPLADAPGSLVAYQFMRNGTLHIRSMMRG